MWAWAEVGAAGRIGRARRALWESRRITRSGNSVQPASTTRPASNTHCPRRSSRWSRQHQRRRRLKRLTKMVIEQVDVGVEREARRMVAKPALHLHDVPTLDDRPPREIEELYAVKTRATRRAA